MSGPEDLVSVLICLLQCSETLLNAMLTALALDEVKRQIGQTLQKGFVQKTGPRKNAVSYHLNRPEAYRLPEGGWICCNDVLSVQ